MKSILRALAGTVAVFFTVFFVLLTVVVVKKLWHVVKPHTTSHRVAVLDLSGLMISSSSFIKDLDETLKNPSVKAIVLRINSPGGLVAPAQEMFQAIKSADEKVPVVISMGSVAASGGYYAALGGRKIYANPGTLTASIGVIMEFLNTEKLYQWAKVERFAMTAGKMKSAGSEFRPMTSEERELFQNLLNDIHHQFKGAVKVRRHLKDEEVDKWCDGRVMSGQQALQAKLVDILGTTEDAIKDAKKLAKLPDSAEVLYPAPKDSLFKRVLFGDGETLLGSFLFGESAGNGFLSLVPGWHLMLLSSIR